ncbi:MAG TPA: helix-turn-helix domain-containing protein [Actinomycetospora sp.]|nr:helix-turn-helix domain-containing protein [Actinomycetospora sp.]
MTSRTPAEPEQARWPRVHARPHPALRPLLARDHLGIAAPTAPRHLVVPASTTVNLVIKLADSPHRTPTFVMGPHAEHIVVDGACAPSYVEVTLEPLGAYTVLDLPMDRLGSSTVDLADLIGPAGPGLAARLRDAADWPERWALVDELLLRRLERGPRPRAEVRHAYQRLVETAGAVPIGALAREVGWSHKHLIHRFTEQVGLRPKTAARLVRLDAVRRRLDRPGAPRWEQISAESGYADQAHFVREFHTLTGTTPTDYATRIARYRVP